MIPLTRLNGTHFAVNSDLIERVDATPDTVICLVDGAKYIVQESIEEVIGEVRAFRASVVGAATAGPLIGAPGGLRVVTDDDDGER